MARYIDADTFVKEMNERIEAATKWGVNAIADRNEEMRVRAEQAIASFCEASLTAKKMPTADVVEVVRCKDCKHYLYSNEKCGLIDTRLNFYATDKIWTNDCFCAWGERSEE